MRDARVHLYKPLAQNLLNSALEQAELTHPDGRPLYRYELSENAYREAGKIVKNLKNSLGSPVPWLDRLFVLYAAHWFRRECYSTAYTWSDLKIVPDSLNTINRGKIVERGFKFWNVSPIENGNGRQWLQTLALNGGIPAKLIADQKETWLDRYLNSVVRDPEAYIDDGEYSLQKTCQKPEHLSHLIEGFRDEIIVNQAVDLLTAVIGWRRELPAGLNDIESMHWLDSNHPHWRNHFALHVEGLGGALKSLISRLLDVSIPKTPAGLTAQRFIKLIKSETGILAWDEEVSIGLDGEAPNHLARSSDGLDCKWDIHLVGRLDGNERIGIANYTATPNKDDGRTNASLFLTPNKRTSEYYRLPLRDPVLLMFSNTKFGRRSLLWQKGESLNQEVLVFGVMDSLRAEYVGSGTVDCRSVSAWLIISSSSVFQLLDAESSMQMLCEDQTSKLYELRGRVKITSGRRHYRIRTNCKSKTQFQLTVDGADFDGLKALNSAISISVENSEVIRWKNGTRDNSRQNKKLKQGRSSLVWKDEDGFVLSRVSVLALPSRATFDACIVDEGIEVKWSGLTDWKLIFPESNKAFSGAQGCCILPKNTKAKIDFFLVDVNQKTTKVIIPVKVLKPLMANSNGSVIESRTISDFSDMRDLYIHLPRREVLELELKTTPRSRVYMNGYSGESRANDYLPMVKALAANSLERGPRVELKVWNGPTLGLFSRPQKMMLQNQNGNILSPPASSGYGVARPLWSPEKVYRLQKIGENEYRLPASVLGPALVYLQDVGRVTTRPILIGSAYRTLPPTGNFTRILGIENERERLSRLTDFFKSLTMASLEYKPKVDLLIKTVVSLRGLSPRSLDMLKVLPDCPSILIAMLFKASAEQRELILNLSEDLPFLWQALPDKAWQNALQSKFLEMQSNLRELDMPSSPPDVIERLKNWAINISFDAPWFGGIYRSLNSEVPSMASLIREHLNIYENAALDTQYDTVLTNPKVKEALSGFNIRPNPGLAAPFALSLAALGMYKLSPEQVIDIRKLLSISPDYINLGYIHAMKDLCHD